MLLGYCVYAAFNVFSISFSVLLACPPASSMRAIGPTAHCSSLWIPPFPRAAVLPRARAPHRPASDAWRPASAPAAPSSLWRPSCPLTARLPPSPPPFFATFSRSAYSPRHRPQPIFLLASRRKRGHSYWAVSAAAMATTSTAALINVHVARPVAKETRRG